MGVENDRKQILIFSLMIRKGSLRQDVSIDGGNMQMTSQKKWKCVNSRGCLLNTGSTILNDYLPLAAAIQIPEIWEVAKQFDLHSTNWMNYGHLNWLRVAFLNTTLPWEPDMLYTIQALSRKCHDSNHVALSLPCNTMCCPTSVLLRPHLLILLIDYLICWFHCRHGP